MTGEMLFLRYAYPCAEIRLTRELISPRDYKLLGEWVRGCGGQPNRGKLKFCFPNAFKALRERASLLGCGTWSLESVTDYWRKNHGHEKPCSVERVLIQSLRLAGKDSYIFINGTVFSNVYDLDVAIGDAVYIHQFCVIEKE